MKKLDWEKIKCDGIDVWQYSENVWRAMSNTRDEHIPHEGPTPLIAVERCYMADAFAKGTK